MAIAWQKRITGLGSDACLIVSGTFLYNEHYVFFGLWYILGACLQGANSLINKRYP